MVGSNACTTAPWQAAEQLASHLAGMLGSTIASAAVQSCQAALRRQIMNTVLHPTNRMCVSKQKIDSLEGQKP